MTAPLPSIPKPPPFDELLSLKGRCAVVTGGSRGLDEAIVRRLAEAGAAVALTDAGVTRCDELNRRSTRLVGKRWVCRRTSPA